MQILDEIHFFDEDNIFKRHFIGKFIIDVKFIDNTLVLETEDGEVWEIQIKRGKCRVNYLPNGLQ